jgi:hypothetical protein
VADVNAVADNDVAQPNARFVHNLRASGGVVLHFGH